jgi:hypothetical protein
VIIERLRILATGRVTWVDNDTGAEEDEHMSWRDRWSLFGVHSWNWRWVRRWGQMGCGCTRNPLSRRTVLTNVDCPAHGWSDWMELGDDD